LRASPLQLCPACRVVSARTTIGGWLVQGDVASPACRKQSELFSFDGAKGVKYQLDDSVVLQRGKGDQLGSCRNDDPEGWMLDEVHGK